MSNTTRPETGPMQFGDDWPGTFIRGDTSYLFARNLNAVLMWLDGYEPGGDESHALIAEVKMHALGLRALMTELDRCNVRHANHDPAKVQKLKPFEACAKEQPVSAPAVAEVPGKRPEHHQAGSRERVNELAIYIASGHRADGSLRCNWSQPGTAEWFAAIVLALDEVAMGVRYQPEQARHLADAMKIGYTVG